MTSRSKSSSDSLFHLWKEKRATRDENELLDQIAQIADIAIRQVLGEHNQDVLQNTLLTLLECSDRFRGESSQAAFIKGVARNKAREHLRETGRGRYESAAPEIVDENYDQDAISSGKLFPTPATMIDAKTKERILATAVDSLSGDHKTCVYRHYYLGESLLQISEALGIPVGTVKTRLYRGRCKMIQSIKDAAKKGDS